MYKLHGTPEERQQKSDALLQEIVFDNSVIFLDWLYGAPKEVEIMERTRTTMYILAALELKKDSGRELSEVESNALALLYSHGFGIADLIRFKSKALWWWLLSYNERSLREKAAEAFMLITEDGQRFHVARLYKKNFPESTAFDRYLRRF